MNGRESPRRDAIGNLRAPRTDPLSNHTHLQQVADCLHVDIGGCDGS